MTDETLTPRVTAIDPSTTGTHREGPTIFGGFSVNRALALCIAVGLGGLAGVVLAVSNLIDAGKLLGPRLAGFELYVRLAGVALGGLILAAALVVVGLSASRWRRPVPSHRRSPEVRW